MLSTMDPSAYSGKVRIRVIGLIYRQVGAGPELLLLRQRVPTRSFPVWMPPGGGLEHTETLEQAVRREVEEECGLSVTPLQRVALHEFIEPPIHALEVYIHCITQGQGKPDGLEQAQGDDHTTTTSSSSSSISATTSTTISDVAVHPLIPRQEPSLLEARWVSLSELADLQEVEPAFLRDPGFHVRVLGVESPDTAWDARRSPAEDQGAHRMESGRFLYFRNGRPL